MNPSIFDKKYTLRASLAALSFSLVAGSAIGGMATDNLDQVHYPSANKHSGTMEGSVQPASLRDNTSTTETLKNIFYPTQKTSSGDPDRAITGSKTSGEAITTEHIRRLLSPSQ